MSSVLWTIETKIRSVSTVLCVNLSLAIMISGIPKSQEKKKGLSLWIKQSTRGWMTRGFKPSMQLYLKICQNECELQEGKLV